MSSAKISRAASELTDCGFTGCDVAIVGAGPAGTSAAIRLAQAGLRIVLFEADKFPRHKLCGEFISPECATHFCTLGVEAQMHAAHPAKIVETNFYTARGRCVCVPSAWFALGNTSAAAIGLSRSEMDARLLLRAREVGVDVREATRVTGVLLAADKTIYGVRFKHEGATANDLRARITLDATGRARVLTRILARAADKQHRQRAQLVAFKAHFVGVRGLDITRKQTAANENREIKSRVGHCEIYFYDGGYGGLNNVEGDVSNLCFIVRAEDVRRCGSDAERVMREVVFCNPRARWALEEARAVTNWLSVALESFGRNPLVPARGVLAIGDAASFIDPFTGSGMLMALESGEVAAKAILAWTSAGISDVAAPLAMLEADYAQRYDQRFRHRLRICSYLRRAAFAPLPIIEIVAATLNVNARVRRFVARATRGAGIVQEANQNISRV